MTNMRVGVSFFFVLLLSMSCGPREYSLEGLAQKGPFQVGSLVTVQELDSQLAAEGVVYFTDTRDDFGAFSLDATIQSPFVEVRVSGYAYDELHFSPFDGPIDMRAIVPVEGSDPGEGSSVHAALNVLTDLQSARLRQLMGQGMGYSDAEAQSRGELLGAFGLPPGASSPPFHQLDLSQDGEANAILLALSSTVLGVANLKLTRLGNFPGPVPGMGASFSETQTRMRMEFEGTGGLASFSDDIRSAQHQLADATDQASVFCRPQCWGPVSKYLSLYYETRGVTATIPNWRPYVDGDGNGTVDNYEP
ncbi:hypothetical protein [Hyalangium versicolor]|uniref:hypothetical protein n=1 Tax=Hyalangium versicolor TaxID=2861190 RepID=UPI001CC980EE|nr:hypothetical protein [Hyalangium versicolor]